MSARMAVCLVTGGAGFLGSHLAEALVKRGHDVLVLDDLSTGSLDNLAGVADRVEFIHGSVTDFDVVRAATAGADYVFHFADPFAGVHGPDDAPAAHHGEATGTLHVLAAAWEAKVKRVVFASSGHVYGQDTGVPRREDDVLQPVSPGGVIKWLGEQQCLGFTGLYGLGLVRLRFFNVFGPRQAAAGPDAPLPQQVVRAMLAGQRPVIPAGGPAAQDLLFVDDAVYATLLAATTPRAAGQVYNVAAGRPTTFRGLVAALNGLLGSRLEPLETCLGSPREVYHLADTWKAEAELGFCPGMDLEKGLWRCVLHQSAQCAARASSV
jgi:UDP-glucose 4-epimerase